MKHMWDVYINSPRISLAGFWQDAFVASYEDLTSEVQEVREAAVSEIAKMSVQYINLDPPPLLSSLSSSLVSSSPEFSFIVFMFC